MAATDYFRLTQQFYLSYLGRPADPRGLEAFAARLDAAGAPTDLNGFASAIKTSPALKILVDSFGSSAESIGFHGSGDSISFVSQMFLNVLGRPAKLAGLQYWGAEIDSGRVSRSEAAVKIMAGAFANTSDPLQAAIDQATVNNRIAVAAKFTAAFDTVEKIMMFKGAEAAALTRYMVSIVNDKTDLLAFQNDIDYVVAKVTGVSVPVPVAGLVERGTVNDDLIALGLHTFATGNGGDDTFTLAGLSSTSEFLFPTITDFSAGDKIVFTDAGDYARTKLGAKVTVDSSIVFKDFLDAAASGTMAGEVRWFTYLGNTYVVNDASSSTTYQDGTDQLIRLTGTLDLSGSTVSDTASLTFLSL